MADWPKHHLLAAHKVTITTADGAWDMTGPSFVACLESGGWTWDGRRRCYHATTGAPGTIVSEASTISPYDELGPWFYVDFDDGLRCWVRQDDITEGERP